MIPPIAEQDRLVRCMESAKLVHFLRREARTTAATFDLDLSRIFSDILQRANAFLPSEAGTVYLDDPLADSQKNSERYLVVVASFGAQAETLLEQRLHSKTGVIGEVYHSGRPYSSSDPHSDRLFRSGPGLRMGFAVESIACAPLEFEGQAIGVIELLNHDDGTGYSDADLELLGIFAQSISLSLVNAIEAQRSKEIAKHDELTGLFNDRHLHHSLSRVIAEVISDGRDCGVVFLDLDHFKSVNDTHGHLVGSRLLHEVGVTLKQIIPGEALAARYGGDEFVVVLPGAGRQETYWVAETIRKNLEDKVFLETADPENPKDVPALCIQGVITCSVGIATLQSDVLPEVEGESLDVDVIKNELMRRADRCMYVAKELGRNYTVPYWDEDLRRKGKKARK